MGTITIKDYTTKIPIQLMGEMAGYCWGADTSNNEKNYKRAIDCIECGHGRVMEFPEVYMIIDGYSARVMRELYTHIGGSPTRLQASTRYINYVEDNFEYAVPFHILRHEENLQIYDGLMEDISAAGRKLSKNGVSNEDIGNILPLGMKSKMVYKVNLRTLIDMAKVRKCRRALLEFRELFDDIENALRGYSEEWEFLVNNYFKCKCEVFGYCNERYSCKRYPNKEFFEIYQREILKNWREQLKNEVHTN